MCEGKGAARQPPRNASGAGRNRLRFRARLSLGARANLRGGAFAAFGSVFGVDAAFPGALRPLLLAGGFLPLAHGVFAGPGEDAMREREEAARKKEGTQGSGEGGVDAEDAPERGEGPATEIRAGAKREAGSKA